MYYCPHLLRRFQKTLSYFERHRVGTLLEPAVIGSSEIVKINPTTKTVTTISGSPDSTELSSVSAAQFEGLSGEETTL
ncbi:hypothetical protein D9757_012769 [Collybiopsis confluens]|uniref:Uncharacterized protein n=1 Tax=Collybiopsis confluens TaxID=2823264 RepID=A0A8H5GKD2_9AGAR|nr:hypothetical protein D9757_012769 [Collybiopsis confluens]